MPNLSSGDIHRISSKAEAENLEKFTPSKGHWHIIPSLLTRMEQHMSKSFNADKGSKLDDDDHMKYSLFGEELNEETWQSQDDESEYYLRFISAWE